MSRTVVTEDRVAQAHDAERALLGAVLVGGNDALAKALAIVRPDDLFGSQHRVVFAAMVRVCETGAPLDPILLANDLHEHGLLETAGGRAFVSSLLDGVPYSANVEWYARVVRNAAERRTKQEALLAEAAALGPEPEDGEVGERRATDLTNARRLVARHGADLRNLHGERGPGSWLVFGGQHWRRDSAGTVVALAKETLRAAFAEAANCDDDKHRERFVRALLASEREGRIAGMVALAASEPGIPVAESELDADPWLLGVPNGVVNLRTGALRQGTRGDLITKQAGCAYDPEAVCPRWEEFLARIMGDNANLVAFLQRAIGYSLTGDTSEDALFVLHGTGSNGKSTFLRVLLDLFGDYGKPAAKDLLLAKRHEGHTTDVADLRGARLVTAVETDEGRRLAVAEVKRLTGGDPVKARFLYQDNFTFEPTWKLFLACNHLPRVPDQSHSIWRRIKLVPFTVVITDKEKVSRATLRAAFREELPGILAWAVRGCCAWQEQGLGEPEEVRAATDEYRTGEDTLGRFLSERCVCDTPEDNRDRFERSELLYKAYTAWAEEQGDRPMPQKAFRANLLGRGFGEKRDKHSNRLLGLALAKEGE